MASYSTGDALMTCFPDAAAVNNELNDAENFSVTASRFLVSLAVDERLLLPLILFFFVSVALYF